MINKLISSSASALIISITLMACSDTKETPETIDPINAAKETCSNLAESKAFPNIAIATATPLPETETLPAFCQITGKITPNIGFEARYPLIDWNGKFFQAGCGGFCGVVDANRETHSNAINHALRRGYAAITTDGGHEGAHIGDPKWAKDNPAAEKVYAEDVLPFTLKAGHQLIDVFYGQTPEYSYFSGCSNGGRMGAIAAQRFPDLFDGIIFGCPVLNLSLNGGVFGSWVLQANSYGQGGRILDHNFHAKLPLLEANAYAQCDAADGSEDGVIAEPFACQVSLDPIPTCEANNLDSCLTADEKSVVRKWYDGPVDRTGKALFYGMPAGSERYWGFWYLGNETFPGAGTLLADGYGAYLGFPEDPDNFSALDFNFDTDVAGLAEQGRLFDSIDPDLSAFQAAGGKMIMWHGMADPLVLPQQSPAYYETVQAEMGADSDISSFFRLFMAPGIGHCWELPAALPDQMSMLEALESWVERGTPPDAIPLRARTEGNQTFPSGELHPYPQTAIYSNSP